MRCQYISTRVVKLKDITSVGEDVGKWGRSYCSWECKGGRATLVESMALSTWTGDKHTPVQFSSVAQSCPTPCDPMDCSTPGLPGHHQLPELTQIHVYWVGDAIQPSHPLSSPSPLAFSLSQHQGLFRWVSSSHQVAKVLEFQLQHQSFQWIFSTDFL